MLGKEHHRRKKARDMLTRAGHSVGGHLGRHISEREDEEKDKRMVEEAIVAHENHDHPGKPHTRLRLADGGAAMGDAPMGRPDQASRGSRSSGGKGKAHGKTNINIVMAPGGGGQQPPEKVPMPVPTQPRAAPPPPPQAPPPRPAGAGMPPGAMPPGLAGAGAPPMGAPPPGGGGMPPGMPMRKDGGRAPMAHLEAGKGSGVGRLELSKEMSHDEHRLKRGGKAEEAWCAGGRA
jgi:hypothetical protein